VSVRHRGGRLASQWRTVEVLERGQDAITSHQGDGFFFFFFFLVVFFGFFFFFFFFFSDQVACSGFQMGVDDPQDIAQMAPQLYQR